MSEQSDIIVARGTFGSHPDVLSVHCDGELLVHEIMGPGGLLAPSSAAEARQRPWFFTGSPFGADIVGLTWERHSAAEYNERMDAASCPTQSPEGDE